jgi:2-polyprenyl-6-methoxyphenol hydroxylase-like FAD-dependent oxidoreductase
MGKTLDIAIAGAGPAGLAAALYLKRAGHKVRVFERFAQPAPVGSGLILQPTGLTILDDLGLLSEILPLGSRIERLYGADTETGRTVLDVRYSALRGGRFGLAVHRAALFGVLYRAALGEGIAVETGAELEIIDNSGEKACLVAVGGTVFSGFDLVIDATGSRSKLKRYAENSREPRPLPYGAFWASLDWRGEGFNERALLQRYRRASVMIGVLPIGRAQAGGEPMAAFFWSLKPDDVEKVRAAGLGAWKERVSGLWP